MKSISNILVSAMAFVALGCGRDPMLDGLRPSVTTTETSPIGTGGSTTMSTTAISTGVAFGTGGNVGTTVVSTTTGGSVGTGGNVGVGGTSVSTETGGIIGSSELEFHLDAANRGQVIAAGTSEVLSARYKVLNTSVAHPLTTLTLVNDLDGAFNVPQDSSAVKQVWVSCSPPSGSGNYIFTASNLIEGKATFSNLNCWDETGKGLEVQIGFDVNAFASVGPSLSGMKVRLGILENTAKVYGQEKISHLTIRKSFPDFKVAVTNRSTSELAEGANRLYGFNVAAIGGSVGLARLTFEVISSSGIGNFKLYRGETLVSKLSLYYVGTNLIISFGNEETIMDGTMKTYYLDADAVGIKKGDQVSVKLVISTTSEFVLPNPCGPNSNTARVYATDGSSIFTGPAGLGFDSITGAETVWSDLSADAHMYPTVTGGKVMDGSGSCDYTNGWGLGVEELEANILTY